MNNPSMQFHDFIGNYNSNNISILDQNKYSLESTSYPIIQSLILCLVVTSLHQIAQSLETISFDSPIKQHYTIATITITITTYNTFVIPTPQSFTLIRTMGSQCAPPTPREVAGGDNDENDVINKLSWALES